MQIDVLSEKLSRTYRDFGYRPYTMSKFEEYELYLRNKDFLVSDRVLTFTDTDGRLMALKPDVTLSIIKNTSDRETGVRKLYYQEHVYRPGKNDQGFREIMQIGLECMGKVDTYCVLEVLLLAIKSLQAINEACVLDISDLALVSRLLDEAGLTDDARKEALKAIGDKNAHELRAICTSFGADSRKLEQLVQLSGNAAVVLPQLQALLGDAPELLRLQQLQAALEAVGADKCVNIDFSVVNDVNYYNGIVFRGFVEGIPEGVLSGGQYDSLMHKLRRSDSAIGFALYPALLERLEQTSAEEFVAVLYYPEDADLLAVLQAVDTLRQKGVCVTAQPGPVQKGSSGYQLAGNEVLVIENDA